MIKIVDLSTLPATLAQKVLFEKLLDHVAGLEPQIGVTQSLAAELKEFRDAIAEGEDLFLSEGTYSRLFHAAVAAQTGTADEVRPRKPPAPHGLRRNRRCLLRTRQPDHPGCASQKLAHLRKRLGR